MPRFRCKHKAWVTAKYGKSSGVNCFAYMRLGVFTLYTDETLEAPIVSYTLADLTVTGTSSITGKVQVDSGSTYSATGAVTVEPGGELELLGSATLALGTSLTVQRTPTNGVLTVTNGSGGATITSTDTATPTYYSITINGEVDIDQASIRKVALELGGAGDAWVRPVRDIDKGGLGS